MPFGGLINSLVLRFQSNCIIYFTISFLRVNCTSNARWESQTFHHNVNSSFRIISRRIFKVIWIRVNYISRLFKQNFTTLNYTLHYSTQHYVQIWHHAKRKRCYRKCGDAFKVFWGKYSRSIVMQLIKIIVNILRKKGTQTIRFVLLCYGIRHINGAFFPRSNPSVGLVWYYHS